MIVEMKGRDRNYFFEDTQLPWAFPSPNMPTVDTAIVYPGQVILEGTNLSEGRGTARPFEVFGSPFLTPEKIIKDVPAEALHGAVLRIVEFTPVFNKWSSLRCFGFQIHVTDRNRYHPYRASLSLLGAIIRNSREEFMWSQPPYEYVFDRAPVDVILGNSNIRESLERGLSVFDMEKEWEDDLKRFGEARNAFLLY